MITNSSLGAGDNDEGQQFSASTEETRFVDGSINVCCHDAKSVGVTSVSCWSFTQNNTEVAIGATVSFLIVSILIGEKFANVVNSMLARLTNQDAPPCVKNEEGS